MGCSWKLSWRCKFSRVVYCTFVPLYPGYVVHIIDIYIYTTSLLTGYGNVAQYVLFYTFIIHRVQMLIHMNMCVMPFGESKVIGRSCCTHVTTKGNSFHLSKCRTLSRLAILPLIYFPLAPIKPLFRFLVMCFKAHSNCSA